VGEDRRAEVAAWPGEGEAVGSDAFGQDAGCKQEEEQSSLT
jgi:hypothetical protein